MTPRKEVFTTQGTPESKQPDRDEIARHTAEFMKRGGKVDKIKGFDSAPCNMNISDSNNWMFA